MKRKNAACTKTGGLLLFQEIQRGRKLVLMKRKKFSQVGATAACTLCLIEGAEYCGLKCQQRVDVEKACHRHLVIADSWFGSVKLAETLKLLHCVPTDNDGNYTYKIKKDKGMNPNGHKIIASVKSNSGWFPRKQINSKMEDWPGRSVVLPIHWLGIVCIISTHEIIMLQGQDHSLHPSRVANSPDLR